MKVGLKQVKTIRRGSSIAFLAGLVLVLALKPEYQPAIEAMTQGEAHLAAREYGAAVEAYRRAAALPPQNPQPLLRIGEIYLAQRRYGLAVDALWEAYDRPGQDDAVLSSLGAAYLGLGYPQAATGYWRTALVLNPANVQARLHLAEILLHQGEWANARQEFEAVLTLEADNQPARYGLGLLLMDDDPTLALAHLTTASRGDDVALAEAAQDMAEALASAEEETNRAYAAAVLGLASLQHDQLSLARRQFETAIQVETGYVEAHAYLGHVLGQLGQDEAALEELQRAVELDASHVLSHYFLGVYYRTRQQWDEAQDAFWTAINLDPKNAALCVEMGRTFVARHDYVTAEEWFRAAVEREQDNAEFAVILARFYVDHGFKVEDEGLAAAEMAVELAPGSAVAHEMLGRARYSAGQLDEAVTLLQKAVTLDDDRASAHYYLGRVYAAQGDEELARRELQRAVDLDISGEYRERGERAIANLSGQ